MYWPSTPKDGVYLFEVQEGAFLDPAKVLGRYKDWTDSSQWPMHPREAEKVREGVKEAQDPTEKTGVVGAFCRVYGIAEAIETFLQDVYDPAQEGRYTYKHGSTGGGLVVYSDRWAYSHHGTDPVSGHLCNSFDLVRLHKYGRLDNRIKEDTPINKRPSFVAMSEFARRDQLVNLDLVKQQTGRAMQAFAGELEQGDADGWLKTLETDKRNKIVGTSDNIKLILQNDPNLKGKFALNEFSSRAVVRGAVPWNDQQGDRWHEDRDDAGLRWYIEKSFGGLTAVNKIYDCLSLVQRENSFHPVRDYLGAQIWDGRPRIETILTDYLGAENNLYTCTVARKMLVGAVARVMEPGVKFDTALVLIGPQGCGKSTFIAMLGGEWYSESFGRMDSKEAVENIQGVWLMEIPELAAFKNAEVEDIKHFMSKKVDEFRPAYGRNVMLFKRQVSFWATSNRWDFNRDQSGGRRFWPVVVEKSNVFLDRIYNRLESERGQIWAEAVELWKSGELLHLDRDVEALAEEVQKEHTEKDPWEGIIREFLEKPITENWDSLTIYDKKAIFRGDETHPKGTVIRDFIAPKDIYFEFLEGKVGEFSVAVGRRISGIMRKIEGWEFKVRRFGKETKRTYSRTVTDENGFDTDGL
jgi:predicted P-loop ATPase